MRYTEQSPMFDSLATQWRRTFFKSRHHLRNRIIAVAVAVVALIGIGFWITVIAGPAWLGVTTSAAEGTIYYIREAPSHKTLWDVLELLIVPASLLTFGFFLSRRQDERVEKEANRRAEIDRQVAAEQAEETAMQAYFDAIADLLLQNDLTDTEEGSGVLELARIRTITVLLRLNGKRKGYVLRFLTDLGMLGTEQREALINLSGANLDGVDMTDANLPDAGFDHVSLAGAKLRRANLKNATLTSANLARTRLMGATLDGVDLSGADLEEAILLRSSLVDADLSDANLDKAVLRNVDMTGAKLEGASLNEAEYDERTIWSKGFKPTEQMKKHEH